MITQVSFFNVVNKIGTATLSKGMCYCGSKVVKYPIAEVSFDEAAERWDVKCDKCGNELMTLLDLQTLNIMGELVN